MFVYSSHGKWAFPPLLWSFPPNTTFTSFPAPGCWKCAAAPAFSGRLVRDSPPLLFGAQGAPPSLLHVFFVVIVYYSVSLFALGGGLCVQGAMLIWHRVVCVSTVYHLAHLVVCIFPIHLGCGPGALLFSLFNMKWRWSMQAGGVEDQIFASSQWFFL
jgi:hypothetical protein